MSENLGYIFKGFQFKTSDTQKNTVKKYLNEKVRTTEPECKIKTLIMLLSTDHVCNRVQYPTIVVLQPGIPGVGK